MSESVFIGKVRLRGVSLFVTIPKPITRALGVKAGDQVEVKVRKKEASA